MFIFCTFAPRSSTKTYKNMETVSDIKTLQQRLDRIEALCGLNKPVLSLNECAALTGFRPSHLYGLTHKKAIPHYKCGSKLIFKRQEIEDWLTSNRVTTGEEAQAKAQMYALDKGAIRA